MKGIGHVITDSLGATAHIEANPSRTESLSSIGAATRNAIKDVEALDGGHLDQLFEAVKMRLAQDRWGQRFISLSVMTKRESEWRGRSDRRDALAMGIALAAGGTTGAAAVPTLAQGRPLFAERRFHSEAVERTIRQVTSRLRGSVGARRLAAIFERFFPNTLDTTLTTSSAPPAGRTTRQATAVRARRRARPG